MWEDQSKSMCEVCNSSSRFIEVFVDSSIVLTDGFKLQGRHGEAGVVQPHLEVTSKRVFNRDRERDENVMILVNSDTDEYQQIWTDDQGNIAFEKQGSLRDPNMHGRASYRPTGRSLADCPADDDTGENEQATGRPGQKTGYPGQGHHGDR
jgi:hypothetical protein